jgi:hypothetical protein
MVGLPHTEGGKGRAMGILAMRGDETRHEEDAMGMDLVRGYEVSFVFSFFWGDCLELAVAFGWRPIGTKYAIADLEHLNDQSDLLAKALGQRKQKWGGWYSSGQCGIR